MFKRKMSKKNEQKNEKTIALVNCKTGKPDQKLHQTSKIKNIVIPEYILSNLFISK